MLDVALLLLQCRCMYSKHVLSLRSDAKGVSLINFNVHVWNLEGTLTSCVNSVQYELTVPISLYQTNNMLCFYRWCALLACRAGHWLYLAIWITYTGHFRVKNKSELTDWNSLMSTRNGITSALTTCCCMQWKAHARSSCPCYPSRTMLLLFLPLLFC